MFVSSDHNELRESGLSYKSERPKYLSNSKVSIDIKSFI